MNYDYRYHLAMRRGIMWRSERVTLKWQHEFQSAKCKGAGKRDSTMLQESEFGFSSMPSNFSPMTLPEDIVAR